MQYPSFKVKEFLVPEFTMDSGKMIRFWVEIIPKKENDTDGYWGVKRIYEIINNYNNQNLGAKIHLCPIQPKVSFIDFIKPIKVGEYLKKTFGEKSNEIEVRLNAFNIKPEYTVRKMGIAKQKALSIICGIEQNEITAFDFYGFAPQTEIELVRYITTKLDEGKSMIAFDNLWYKEEQFDKGNIKNLIISRVRK